MAHYYAISYAYGPVAVNQGNRADVAYRFATRQDRDKWVAARDSRAAITRQALRARMVHSAVVLDWDTSAETI